MRFVDPGKRIPSLDGLRALSIILVLVHHVFIPLHPESAPQRLLFLLGDYGPTGVSIFFVISGFLITLLLKRERQQFGEVSLRAFYIRRVFRILPAYLAYLLCLAVLVKAGSIEVGRSSFLHALTFTTDYAADQNGHLGHTWSLSVEEQFYILWPLIFVTLRSKTLVRVALAVLLLEPVVRLFTYFLMPAFRGQVGHMGHTRADTLMFGCLAALLYDSARFRSWVGIISKRSLPVLLSVATLLVLPQLESRLRGMYIYLVEFTAQGLCITVVLLYAIHNEDRLFGKLLNSRAAVHIGVISYSLYLWQQLWLGITGTSPLSITVHLLIAFLCAELSYLLVEKPLLRLGRRFRRERVVGQNAQGQPVPCEALAEA